MKRVTHNKKGGVKTRMAPSPTGKLHIGGLRTALYNYLFARQNGGEFLLRIEDTDRARFVPGATEEVFAMLKWAGLNWDGEPVVQSKRLKIYQQYAQKLVDEGNAYYCFCTPEELAKISEKWSPKQDLEENFVLWITTLRLYLSHCDIIRVLKVFKTVEICIINYY